MAVRRNRTVEITFRNLPIQVTYDYYPYQRANNWYEQDDAPEVHLKRIEYNEAMSELYGISKEDLESVKFQDTVYDQVISAEEHYDAMYRQPIIEQE